MEHDRVIIYSSKTPIYRKTQFTAAFPFLPNCSSSWWQGHNILVGLRHTFITEHQIKLRDTAQISSSAWSDANAEHKEMLRVGYHSCKPQLYVTFQISSPSTNWVLKCLQFAFEKISFRSLQTNQRHKNFTSNILI